MKESIFDIVNNADRCAQILREHRWPDGITCPRCSSGSIRIRSRRRDGICYYQCKKCLKGFSDTTGTIFERSHLMIDKWFQIAFLMRRNLPDIDIAQDAGVEENTARRATQLIRGSAFFKDALPMSFQSSGSGRCLRECRPQRQWTQV